MFQRRFAEAVQLEDRAIDLFRTLDNSRLLVPALILRASIFAYRAQPRAMIPDLREARKHLESCDDARLELTVCNNLAYGYAVTGEHEAAAELLPQVKVLCRESGSWLEWHQIQWVEGLLSQAQKDTAAAAQKFQEARAGFLELGEMDHAAVVALDEAILSAEQGRTKEVVELVTAALPAFEALRTQREAVAALRLLEKALAAEDLSLAVLREARAHPERLRLDPSRHRCRSYDLAG